MTRILVAWLLMGQFWPTRSADAVDIFPCPVTLGDMPKSKLRKKVQEQHAHDQELVDLTPQGPLESPKWLAPTMVGSFLVGLLWIVTFYVSQTQYPIPNIGAWNMLVGFTFIAFGFSLATKWR
jgi:hypothetical protein